MNCVPGMLRFLISLVQLLRNFVQISITEQESPQEHPTEMRTSTSPGTAITRRPSKHPQTCCWPVQQSSPTRFQSQAVICYKRRPKENSGNQSRARISTRGICQHNQQLLSRRNCQVSVQRFKLF